MEVKSILEKIRSKKEEEKKECFFALVLEEGLVKSSLWTIESDTVKILAFGEEQVWEKEEGLLEAVDAALPQGIEEEVNRVVFGVSPTWVAENKIVDEKLNLLRKVSKELELEAVGFVVTSEAIVHHLKVREGIPLTAILVGREKEKLALTLVKLGKIVGTQIVSCSEDFGADLAEGLCRFSQEESFPPRILLYNHQEKLEEEREQLMNFSWQEAGINFLHLPKVEVLVPDFDLLSVSLAGGREVAKAEKIISPEKEEPVSPPMGFVKDQDIAQEIEAELPKPPPKPSRKINFGPFWKFLGQLKQKMVLKRFSLTAGLVVAFLLILGGFLTVLWWYWPKAQVTLYVKSQILEKDFTLRLDRKLTAVDKEKLALPAEEMEVVLESEKSQPTSGTKLVGESAKGEVTIFNRTSGEKIFSAKTEIVGPNNLKFSLDEKVTVASESAGENYAKIPGKVKVKITSLAIGAESNLAAGTEFAMANFSKSDYVAKNEEAFSGGTSREVQVVSENDQKQLAEVLTVQMKEKALEELKMKIDSGRELVKESLTTGVIEKKFTPKLDEESNELNLFLKLKFSALSFAKEEFKSFIEKQVQQSIPEGFEYKPEESQIDFRLKEVDKQGVAIFETHFKTNLFPVLDLEGIKKNLVGKHPSIGENYLGTLPMIDSFEAKIIPRLPSRLASFPRVAKNIKIEVRKE